MKLNFPTSFTVVMQDLKQQRDVMMMDYDFETRSCDVNREG